MIVLDGKITMNLVSYIIRKALMKTFDISDVNTTIRKISLFEKDERFCISLDADIDAPAAEMKKVLGN